MSSRVPAVGSPRSLSLSGMSPLAVVRHFARHRGLLEQLTRREILSRYRGSWLGVLWSVLTPLAMLGAYTFVFTLIFPGRGMLGGAGRLEFALALFAGMTAFNLFAEVVSTSPRLIVEQVNFVKKVVFPLEVLPVARFAACAAQMGVSLGLLLIVLIAVKGISAWTAVFLPPVLVPLALFTLGCGFFLASLGVFFRDINHVIGPAVTLTMLLSPVFYPLSRVPEPWRRVMLLNPLSTILEQVRLVTMHGELPDWGGLAAVTLFAALWLWGGLAWFIKSKNAFADVL